MRILITTLALFVLPAFAHATDYRVDPDHTKVTFKVRHLGLSWVPGIFEKFEGTFNFDPKNIAAAQAEAKIDTASINTGNEKRDGHLKSDDFFSAGKFP